MKSLLVAGDTHGDPQHLIYLFQMALNENVDGIFQVGDYGYWEHHPDGWSWLDMNSDLAVQNNMPFYWIDGNHENHTMLRRLYGPGGSKHKPTPEGFWEIRPGVYYVPRGTRWVWNGKHLMGLGGAYSVDKASRLEDEKAGEAEVVRYRKNAWHLTGKLKHIADAMDRKEHWLWWPEEEITDEDLATALADPTPLDILFTHDKPRASTPGWNRKDFLPCFPNQDKIQTVVNTLQPRLLLHGHLHYPYQDEIRCGNDGKTTTVIGLHNNPDRAVDAKQMWQAGKQRRESWVKLNIT